ncbi:hypothetical protein ACGFXC_04655 [Streptomyces sp. NPDC048507]|uniref:hypothetical protein n=1 Tax=Streptomyces sp. NPDC048507 TaxID=3365560 RepID=UPI003711CD2E
MAPPGDLIGIDGATVLVLGQELDFAHGRPDVADSPAHRTGDTLVPVDTGVTPAFRDARRPGPMRSGRRR